MVDREHARDVHDEIFRMHIENDYLQEANETVENRRMNLLPASKITRSVTRDKNFTRATNQAFEAKKTEEKSVTDRLLQASCHSVEKNNDSIWSTKPFQIEAIKFKFVPCTCLECIRLRA